jgi:Uma2 family endonuclease
MIPGVPATARYTAARYLALVDEGVLHPDDRVELLEGVIVAMSPHNPPHASAVRRAYEAVHAIVEGRAVVSVQLPLVVSGGSVPEPDVAVLPGSQSDYDTAHPTTALLVVEIADNSLLADRLTKAPIYAAAGIPEYWIVNLRDDVVEVFRAPDRAIGQYQESTRVGRGGRLSVLAFDGTSIAVDDVLPANVRAAR